MSLAAELLIARISAECGSIRAVLSWSGLGCPLLDMGANPPHRLAMRPLGGVSPGGRSGLAAWAPPIDLTRDKVSSARLAAAGVMMVDACTAPGQDVLWRGLSPLVGVVRLRGQPPEGPPEKSGFTLLFEDDDAFPEQRDFVLLRDDLLTDGVQALADDLKERKVDEFDFLRDVVGDGDLVQEFRYKAGISECHLHPVRLLDQPDAQQLDVALGEGRVVLDRNGEISIAAPQFAARAAPVGLTITGGEPGGLAPTVFFDDPEGWKADIVRRRDGWRLTAMPIAPSPSEVTAFEVRLPGGVGAEITETWVGVSRRRAAWEDWDEADARLALEESW